MPLAPGVYITSIAPPSDQNGAAMENEVVP